MIHMHQPLQPIIQHLFQVSSLEDVSRQQLESFVEEYPSFGIGHYLLSCKLRGEDQTRFQTETQRTSLYFSNPFWLQWLLDNTENGGGRTETAVETVHGMEPVQEPVVTEAVVNAEEAVAVEAMSVEAAAVEPVAEVPAVEQVVEVPAIEPVAVEPATEAPVEVQAPVLTAGEPEEPAVEEAVITEPVNNVVTVAEEAHQVPETAATVEEAGSSAADQLLRSIEEARELRDSLHKINEGLAEEPIRDEETPFVLEETETNHMPVEAGAVEAVAGAVEPGAVGSPVVADQGPVTSGRAAGDCR